MGSGVARSFELMQDLTRLAESAALHIGETAAPALRRPAQGAESALEALPNLQLTRSNGLREPGQLDGKAFSITSSDHRPATGTDGFELETPNPNRQIEWTRPGSHTSRLPKATVERTHLEIDSMMAERDLSYDLREAGNNWIRLRTREVQLHRMVSRENQGAHTVPWLPQTGAGVAEPNVSAGLKGATSKGDFQVVRGLQAGPKRQERLDPEMGLLRTSMEKIALENRMTREIALRHGELTEIMNLAAPQLFPEETLPAFTVVRLPKGENAAGLYMGGGRIGISDNLLIRHALDKPDVVRALVHEGRHGAHEGLIIHNSIDTILGDMVNPREEDFQRVSQHIGQTVGPNWGDVDTVKTIFARRNGQRLSEAQHLRAERLEASIAQEGNQNLDATALESAQSRIAQLLSAKPDVAAQEFLAQAAANPNYLLHLFEEDIPDWVPQSLDRYRRADSPAAIGKVVHESAPTIMSSLSARNVEVERMLQAHTETYRDWFHEQEPHEDGAEVTDRVNELVSTLAHGSDKDIAEILRRSDKH